MADKPHNWYNDNLWNAFKETQVRKKDRWTEKNLLPLQLSLVLFSLHLYVCKQHTQHANIHTHTLPSLCWFSWEEKSPLQTSRGEQRFWLHGAPVSADTDRQSHSCLCMCIKNVFLNPSHLWKTYSHAESSSSNVRIDKWKTHINEVHNWFMLQININVAIHHNSLWSGQHLPCCGCMTHKRSTRQTDQRSSAPEGDPTPARGSPCAGSHNARRAPEKKEGKNSNKIKAHFADCLCSVFMQRNLKL